MSPFTVLLDKRFVPKCAANKPAGALIHCRTRVRTHGNSLSYSIYIAMGYGKHAMRDDLFATESSMITVLYAVCAGACTHNPHMCIGAYVYVYIRLYALCVYIRIRIHVHVYAYMYICAYMYIYTYTVIHAEFGTLCSVTVGCSCFELLLRRVMSLRLQVFFSTAAAVFLCPVVCGQLAAPSVCIRSGSRLSGAAVVFSVATSVEFCSCSSVVFACRICGRLCSGGVGR